MPIKNSVGTGGRNAVADVFFVQLLLNDWRVRNQRNPIAVDGLVGQETVGAIEEFQRRVTGKVDGRVDPAGPAIEKLEEFHFQGILSGEWYLPHSRFRRQVAADNPLVRRAHEEYLKALRENLARSG